MVAASREVKFVRNLSGGLNFGPNQNDVRENQTPDALNVDFHSQGGFVLRGGFGYLLDQPTLDGAQFLHASYYSDDVLLLKTSDGYLSEFDGSTNTISANLLTDSTTERVRSDDATFELSGTRYNKSYFANGRSSGSVVMRTWDGTTFATLGTDWNNDYSTPTGGNMPLGKHIAFYNNFMWVADTTEAGINYPHRVRFSHVGMPEDFGEDDYFDVDPSDDGDPITQIIAVGQSLMVFKRSSVWMVYGYDRDTYILEQFSTASGVCSCGAADTDGENVYWWSTDGRLWRYGRNGLKMLSAPISWWSENGKILHGGRHRVKWMDGRLWMRLEAGSGEAVAYWLFIYDPESDTFTRYDKDVADLFFWQRIGVDGLKLFLFEGSDALFSFDRNYLTDDDQDGAVVRIDGYFRTAWFNAGETATRKRWKRPRLTASADSNTTIDIDVFFDLDSDNVSRSMQTTITVPGEASLWGTAVWGDAWYLPSDNYYNFSRLGSTGSGYTVSYKFSSPDNPGRWAVDQLAIPYRRKTVK